MVTVTLNQGNLCDILDSLGQRETGSRELILKLMNASDDCQYRIDNARGNLGVEPTIGGILASIRQTITDNPVVVEFTNGEAICIHKALTEYYYALDWEGLEDVELANALLSKFDR